MNKIALMLTIALGLFLPVKAEMKSVHAVVTYYWPGEKGGRYDCDGKRLHEGVAAVDFDVFPKGTELTIADSLHVVANDCGGSAVISRKAARERGFHCPVIDVWVHSEREATDRESEFPKVALVTYDVSGHHSVARVSRVSREQVARVKPDNSKFVCEHARIERYEMLAID